MVYLSVTGQSYGVVGATGHFCHPLVDEVGGDQCGDQTMVGGPISKLAVAIVAPGKHLPIYRATGKISFMLSEWLIFS